MTIIRVPKRKRTAPILFVRVNTSEALKLIQSLTNQLIARNPNVGRWECYASDGTDVSIAVHADGEKS